MPGTPIQALWQWSGPHAAAKVYLFCRFRFTLMAIRGETGHTGPTEGNTTDPLCKGVPIRPIFGSPLMAFRGETGHTGPTEGNTTAPLCKGVPILPFSVHFDGHSRRDRPYRTYGREHNRSPMQRCTNSCHFRFTFDGHPRGDRPYRTYGSGSHRQPSAQVYQFVPFSVHLCRRATLKPSLQTLLQCSGPHGTAKVYPKSGKTVHL